MSGLRRRIGTASAALLAAGFCAAAAQAATLDVGIDNPTAGTAAAPNPLNVSFNYDSGIQAPGPGVPLGTLSLTVDRGLRLGEPAGAPSCTSQQVLADDSHCPLGSEIAQGAATVLAPDDPDAATDGSGDSFVDADDVTLTGYDAPGGRGLVLLAFGGFPSIRALVPTTLDAGTLTLTWPADVQFLGAGGADGLLALNLSLGQAQDPSGSGSGDESQEPLSWISAVTCSKSWAFSAVAADAASNAPASATSGCDAAPPPQLSAPDVGTLPTHQRTASGHTDVCQHVRIGVQCGPGNGRRTSGGAGKVSHAGWPAVTGALMIADNGGRTEFGTHYNDELLGGNGSDHLTGGAGNDILWGDQFPAPNSARQRDTLSGGAGNDWIYTSHGSNTVNAGPGNDTIYAYYGHGTIDCGSGNDIVFIRRLASNERYTLRNCEREAKL